MIINHTQHTICVALGHPPRRPRLWQRVLAVFLPSRPGFGYDVVIAPGCAYEPPPGIAYERGRTNLETTKRSRDASNAD